MLRSLSMALCLLSASALFAGSDLPATISANTTLAVSGSPYYLRSDVSIATGVTVTLQPGVQVIATGDYRLFVNGTLRGSATSTAAILLRGPALTVRGCWQGVYVARGGRCDLSRVTIRNAVTNVMCAGGTVVLTNCVLTQAAEDGLLAWNAATVQLNSCKLYSNTRRGLRLEGDQVKGLVTLCDFRSNGGYPVRLKATLVELLGSGNLYAKNGQQRLSVSCSLTDDITDVDTWLRQAVPYELGAEETGQALRISKGGKLFLPAGATVLADRLDCLGELQALGTVASRCTFQPRSGGRGGWQGLTFYPASKGVLTCTTVREATTGITADGATLQVSDSTISNCLFDGLRLTGTTTLNLQGNTISGHHRNGLRLEGEAMLGSVSNCRFLANKSHPVWAIARNVTLLGAGNSYQNNTQQRLAVSCASTSDLPGGVHNWTRQGLPLDLTVDPAGTTLNIATAATLNVAAGQTLYLGGMLVNGTLNVNGTVSQLVNFRPKSGTFTPGAWNGLQFSRGGGRLSGASVEGATTALNLSDASPTVTDCLLRNSQYDGLACSGAAAPVVTGCQITANARHGVYITGTARPNLGDLTTATTTDNGANTLSDNGGFDVYNATSGTIRAQNNTWSSRETAAVALRIFDHTDDATRGVVVFSPQHSLPATVTAPLAPPRSLVASATRGGTVQITWQQAASAQVLVRVVTLAGRPVAAVCRGQNTEPGPRLVYWSRLSDRGVRVPAGRYLVLLEARQQDGTVHRLAAPLSVP